MSTSSAPVLKGRVERTKERGKSKTGIEKRGKGRLRSRKNGGLFSAKNKDNLVNLQKSNPRTWLELASSSWMLRIGKRARLTPTSTTSPSSKPLLPTRNHAVRPVMALPIHLYTNRRLGPRSHTPYPMGKIVKTPHASRGTSVAMSRVDQSNHPLPPRILEGVTYTRSRQIIRKNGIIATSVGCGRSACVITPTTSAVNLSQDLKRSGRKEPKKTGEEERGGSGHCGDGKGHDIYGDGGDLPPTTEQSPVHCEKPPILKLRGGGGSVNEDGKDTKLKRLEDDERVPALIWYFAGNKGPPPTGKQLRDRREKEKAYIERKQAGADARKEERQAKWKGRKAAVPGSFWKNPFRRKKKRVKLRADEEGKDKEVVDEPEPAPGASEAENAAE